MQPECLSDFRDETVFVEVAETIHPIPTEGFRFIERLFLQIPWRCVEMEITEFDGNNCSGCGDAVVPKPITALGDDQIRLGGWRLGL
ncbi:hypothetical protein YC2023_008870 [Brassica napus]